MADATLLLLAMALGAIVVLAVLRLTQAESQSMRASSADLLRMATDSLAQSSRLVLEGMETAEKQVARDRVLGDVVEVVKKLDVTVSNLYLSQMSAGRTVLRREPQVGEAPPDSPGVTFPRATPLPPEGMVAGSSPAAAQMRQHAFAEPT